MPHKLKSAFALLLALGIALSLSQLMDLLIQTTSWYSIVSLEGRAILPSNLLTLWIAAFFGGLISAPYYLHCMLIIQLLFYGWAVHIFQRITENVPNAPTYLDVLSDSSLSILLGLIATVAGVYSSQTLLGLLGASEKGGHAAAP